MLRALYQWALDQNFTLMIQVQVDEHTQLPPSASVSDDMITLNISPEATRNLEISDEVLEFDTRFSGVTYRVVIPAVQVLLCYARENEMGLRFASSMTLSSDPDPDPAPDESAKRKGPPRLVRIK